MPPITLKPPATATKRRQRTYIPRFKRMEDFMKWQPEDGYKYEWNDGVIEKTKYVKHNELFIIHKLQKKFTLTAAYTIGSGLLSETDIMTSPVQLRRPDLAYFTEEQIKAARYGTWSIPAFVAEIISPNDLPNVLVAKRREYLKAGVKTIWYIYPDQQEVHIFNANTTKICMENDICTAAPALPDFAITIEELFGE